MRTTRSNPVIMPNGEQGEQTSREFAMSRQMRPDNAMPIFHSTTGADGLIPGSQKVRGDCSPSRVNALQQVLARWTKHGPTQPCPRQQSDPPPPQAPLAFPFNPLKPPPNTHAQSQ